MTPTIDRPTMLMLALIFTMSGAVGCTRTYRLDPVEFSQWPEYRQVDMHVHLHLSDELRGHTYEKHMLGDRFRYPVGPVLALGAAQTAEKAFTRVTVSEGGRIPTVEADGILTPDVVGMEQATSIWAFEAVDTSIDLLWTLKDPDGNTLWAKTIRGTSRHHLGNAFTHRSAARKRVSMCVEDLFHKSLVDLTTAQEILQLSGQ
ncbi:MAG: hypothetical protein JJU36_04320 [Phycisphaeraceae bacterium]|nr:hypothetical protein [Phycisphaeraceae bacterium]